MVTPNRLTTIRDWSLRETQYGYDGLRIDTVTYPNGVLESRSYDLAGRLEGMSTQDASIEEIGLLMGGVHGLEGAPAPVPAGEAAHVA